MQTGLAAVLHDAAVLYRLADFIEEYCKEQERSQRYTDASGEFFHYAEAASAGIKLTLQNDLEHLAHLSTEKVASRTDILRRKIRTFKDYLRLLHTLIKPAAEAHTLSIPAPLIKLACQQLQGIAGMEGADIVVLLTPQLMYFQRPHTHIREQAERIARLVPKAKLRKLGFIEVPYSQGPGFFTNLAVYHEISHFVYEELPTLRYAKDARKALVSATNQSLRKVGKSKEPPDQQLADQRLRAKILESWTQEIFCDLLALRLVGPAFSFAFVEILNLVASQSPEAMLKFSLEHPAPACRFAEHVELLGSNDWWNVISDIQPEQKRLIEKLAQVDKINYGVYEGVPNSLIPPFVDLIVPAIRKLVAQLAPGGEIPAQTFKKERKDIESCLSVGVVPQGRMGRPLDPVSVINAAFAFYLTTLPKVAARFEGASAESNVKTQSKWIKKLEDWTMKAIENSELSAQFERQRKHGSV